MNLYENNVAEFAKLTPHRKERFLRFMDAAFAATMTFAVKAISETTVELTPIAVSDQKHMTQEQLRNHRLIELERLGSPKFGVFRSVENRAFKKNVGNFTAYELAPPPKYDLLADRLAALCQ